MSVVKVIKKNRYVSLDNTMVSDKRLRWGARGLLAFLLSKPDDWSIKISHLITQGPESKDYILARFKELEQFGYLEVGAKYRDPVSGRFVRDFTLYEQAAEKPRSEIYQSENPAGCQSENPTGEVTDQSDLATGTSRNNRPAPVGKSDCTNTETNTDTNNYRSQGENFTVGKAVELVIEMGVTTRSATSEHSRKVIIELLKLGATKTDFVEAIKRARNQTNGEAFGMAYLEKIIRDIYFKRTEQPQNERGNSHGGKQRKSAADLARDSLGGSGLSEPKDITGQAIRVNY